ncbi:RNA polymerase I enhancer binding protein [Entomortierella beljakovae]|nr:RNA polymerase I enhancer binding protein [Entomortierella beljakovae]
MEDSASRKRKNNEDTPQDGSKKVNAGDGSGDISSSSSALGDSTTSIHHELQSPSSPKPHLPTSKPANATNGITNDVNTAAINTVVDLLVGASDDITNIAQLSNADKSQYGNEILKMQRELEQQIPQNAADTQLTREQMIESITGMRMIIEGSLNGHRDASHSIEQSNKASQLTAVNSSSILMSLNDPSILATMEPTISHAGPSQAAVPSNGISQDRDHNGGEGSSLMLEDQTRVDPGAVTSDNPLHTKWLMANALKEKGTFSSHEDELIRQTITEYVKRNNMAEDSIQRWFQNGNGRGRFEKNDLKALWVEIAARLKNRPLLNIYLHVRRMFHPQNNVGAWSKEDDQKLVMLYTKHRGQWTVIGTELGRMADSCRDRYRNHLKDQSTMVTGPWQPHEDERLLSIMQELALQQGKANILDSSPMWTLISERMQGTRTRHQCRHRYSQTLQPRLERGEWTAPSSAAAAAAAAVAANTAANATSTSAKQQQQNLSLELDMSTNSGNDNSKAAQNVLMLAAALQGVLPTGSDDSLLWAQSTSPNPQDSDRNSLNGSVDGNLAGGASRDENDTFPTAMFTSSIPPSLVPRAVKGPIRRRSGLQQQVDVLKMIQVDGYTDHTDIKWADIAQRLRDRVEEGNAIQLARIIQTHDKLDSKKHQHLQDNDGTADAAAAASAAMAVAVSVAQAEAVASLQRVPAANQIARTFMSSRCKIEGYKEMTLQQVIIPMMMDVERRIQHRRGVPRNRGLVLGSKNGEGSSNPLDDIESTAAFIQQQEINNAAQQAAIAALSAQFPILLQHQQQRHPSILSAHTQYLEDLAAKEKQSSGSVAISPVQSENIAGYQGHAAPSQKRRSTSSTPLSAEEVKHNQELEQQQHNRDLAEQMIQVAFSSSDMSHIIDSLAALSSLVGSTTSSSDLSLLESAKKQKQATRRVLDALKSNEVAGEYNDEEDEEEEEIDEITEDSKFETAPPRFATGKPNKIFIMRFQVIIASAIALVAVVSAQTSPDIPTADCMSCMNDAVLAAPACKGITLTSNPDPSKIDEKSLKCVCSMAANQSWLDGCSSKCSSSVIQSFHGIYDMVKSNNCAGVATSDVKSDARSLSIPKAGAALAVAAAAAQALL